MEARKCSTCHNVGVVAVPHNPSLPESEPQPPRTVHVCRGEPPKAFLVPDREHGVRAVSIWPQVDAETDFCSMHYTMSAPVDKAPAEQETVL